MEIKNFKKVMVLMIGLIVVFLLAGCWGNHSDKIKINHIGKNIEKALKKKDVDLFMENHFTGRNLIVTLLPGLSVNQMTIQKMTEDAEEGEF